MCNDLVEIATIAYTEFHGNRKTVDLLRTYLLKHTNTVKPTLSKRPAMYFLLYQVLQAHPMPCVSFHPFAHPPPLSFQTPSQNRQPR